MPASTARVEPPIVFQKYFRSWRRTYAAQVRRAANGGEILELMEGRRDSQTGQVRKTRLLIYEEDLAAFFCMLSAAVQYLRQGREGAAADTPGAAVSSASPAPLPLSPVPPPPRLVAPGSAGPGAAGPS